MRGGHNKALFIGPVAYDEFVNDILYPRGAFSNDCDESNAIAKALLDKGR